MNPNTLVSFWWNQIDMLYMLSRSTPTYRYTYYLLFTYYYYLVFQQGFSACFFNSSCYIMKQFAVCVLWIVHNPSVEVWIIEEINVHRSLACVYESLLHKGSAFINDLLEGLTTKWNITAGSAHAQQPTLNQLAVSEPQGEQQTKVLFRSIHTGRNNASSYTKWTPCLYRVVLIERKQH